MKSLLALLVAICITNRIQAQDSIPYSTIYIYRPQRFEGSLLGYDLNFSNSIIKDGIIIAKIRNNTKTIVKLNQEGECEFWANIGATRSIKVKLEFGKSYYIKCELETGITIGRPVLTLMSEEQGKNEFEQVKKVKKAEVE
jgi:hypothetical protein